MDHRDNSDSKRRAIEGILGRPAKADPPALPDTYRPTGIGTTFEPPARGGNRRTALIVAAVIVIIALFATFLIIARDQVLGFFGAAGGAESAQGRGQGPTGGASGEELTSAARAEDVVTLENLRSANKSLELRLQQAQSRSEKLAGDVEQLTREVGRLRAELPSEQSTKLSGGLAQKVVGLESQLDDAAARADRLARNNEILRTQMERQNEAFNLQLGQFRTDNERLRGRISSLERDISASESELRTLRSSVDRSRTTSDQLEEVNSEYRRVLDLLQQAQASNRRRDERIEELQDENVVLRRRISSLADSAPRRAETDRESSSAGPLEQGAPGVTNPVPIDIVRPSYPASAYRRKVSGIVRIKVLVSERGEVLEAEVLSSPDPLGALDRAALGAARRWKFNPALREGSPVQIWYVIPMEFKLNS